MTLFILTYAMEGNPGEDVAAMAVVHGVFSTAARAREYAVAQMAELIESRTQEAKEYGYSPEEMAEDMEDLVLPTEADGDWMTFMFDKDAGRYTITPCEMDHGVPFQDSVIL